MNSLREKTELLEKEEIVLALLECHWVKARAAKMLGITERMIGYRIKKYGIEGRRKNLGRMDRGQ